MAVRTRRISKEIQQFIEESPDHIFIDFKEDDMTHLEVLFIGPRYTPYSRMFMRFTVDFPIEYPIKPPKVVFTSSYNRKIHPNVFPGGWLCLSTLNTGDSSGWVPSINLSALLKTIYSMFTKEMIMIDNSHEHEKSEDFFPGIMHDTFYITTKLLSDEHNAKFKEIMHDYSTKHCNWYTRKLERLSEEYDDKIIKNYYQPNEPQKANFKSILLEYQAHALNSL